MNCKKWIMTAAAVFAVAGMSAKADIAFQYASGGGWLPGGDFATGPYPEVGFYYQVLWSPSDPGDYMVGPGGSAVNGSEVVLLDNFSTRNYGYVYFGDDPAIVVNSNTIGGADPNTAGWVYSRIYQDATVDAGDNYYQSAPVATSTFPVYDPQLPNTIGGYRTDPGGLTSVVVPEPSTALLLALSGVVLAIRRQTKRS